MMKLDQKTAGALKGIFCKFDIHQDRVVIDFDEQLIYTNDSSRHDDLLACAGILTHEEAEELKQFVKKSREEWD